MNPIPCPVCRQPLEFDEVDIGVGVQMGNFRCPSCGWYESMPELSPSQIETLNRDDV